MKSPIEKAFVSAFMDVAPVSGASVSLFRPGLRAADPNGHPEALDDYLEAHGEEQAQLLVFPQAKIDHYKIDFVLLVKGTNAPFVTVLGVECDGHEWHERTPQQASYDRARDRYLLSRYAIPIIRFTGSDIHRDANQCANETIECIKALHFYQGRTLAQAVEQVGKDIEAEKKAKER